MSVQVKILYGHNYDRCKKTTISERTLGELNLESLSEVVRKTVGTFYQAAKTLRIQYRDDEGTFVTVTSEQDVEDAINSCQPISQGDVKITRLCLRVDDACTPVETQKSSSPPRKKRPRPCEASKCLSFTNNDDLDEEEEIRQMFSVDANSSSELTPYQRYRKKIDGDIEAKRAALLDVEQKDHEVRRKLLRVKSNPSDGNICRNCHMRLGHTARNCDYEKCNSVFRCGEEKHHPGEIDSRGTRVSIQKLKADIAKLERERDLKEVASKKLNESLAKQVETSLLEENVNLYMVNGSKNWSLLRKHVFIIEKYCKEHFSGKIPAKHNLSDILSLALEGASTSGDRAKGIKQQTQVKSKRGNPARSVLETHGINFPDPTYDSLFSGYSAPSSSNLLHRCKPVTKEEEQAQLDMALRQSVLDNTPLQPRHESLAPTYPYLWPQTQTPFMFHPFSFSGTCNPSYLANQDYPAFQQCMGEFHEEVPNTRCSATHSSSTQSNNLDETERPHEDLDITDAAMQLISLSSRQSCTADKK